MEGDMGRLGDGVRERLREKEVRGSEKKVRERWEKERGFLISSSLNAGAERGVFKKVCHSSSCRAEPWSRR